MTKNNYQTKGHIYAKHGLNHTAYLAFKNIPEIISKYSKGKKTLDYGCGSGRSTRFLKELGLILEGVDTSEEMIRQAKEHDNTPYQIIESAKIPSPTEYYDVVFSSLVLFEISSKSELIKIFKEIYRVLKNDGIFVAVTGSTEMYSHEWSTLGVDYEENKNLKSGSIAKILFKDIQLELYDYFWTDNDYQEIIKASNFHLAERKFPLGDEKDGFKWISETNFSPYVVYVLKKNIVLP